ncbi:MAG: hypothetical protein NUV91_03080, partial [Candidatus Omnitrophica bacterium]|nr:hypothetical protein [Candidatus Omnitrophota bacterium]
MKALKNFILGVFLLVLVLFIAAYFLVEFKGKEFLPATLQNILERPVAIEEVKFLPPMGLYLKNVKVEGALEAENIKLQLGFPFVMGPRIVFSSIDVEKPLLIITKTSEKKFAWGQALEVPLSLESPSASPEVAQTEVSPKTLQGIAIQNFFIN